jgi:hypothetical protein
LIESPSTRGLSSLRAVDCTALGPPLAARSTSVGIFGQRLDGWRDEIAGFAVARAGSDSKCRVSIGGDFDRAGW